MQIFELWKSYIHVLLLHPTESKVLLQSNKDNYHLPCVDVNQRIFFDDFESVKDAINEKLSISTNVLYYASYQVNKKKRKIRGIYVLEQRHATEEIQTGSWFDLSTLKDLPFERPEHKSIIEKCLNELQSASIPNLRFW